MGWLRRVAAKANEVAPDLLDPTAAITVALDPAARRCRKLEARGTPADGVVTGVRFRLDGETTRKEYAISVLGPTGPERFGVRVLTASQSRLRLGLQVVVKHDGGRAVLDWEAMTAAWGWPPSPFSQEPLRKPPADGIEDGTVDWRVQRHLKRWVPTSARIVELRRRRALGMPTLDWDVVLELPDGARAVSTGDEVPTYAYWDAVPGATVAAVVDPEDRSRASIDWRSVALSTAATTGFDDDPPAGSIAAAAEAPSS